MLYIFRLILVKIAASELVKPQVNSVRKFLFTAC